MNDKNFGIIVISDDNFVIGLEVALYTFLQNNMWFDGDINILHHDELCKLSVKNRNRITEHLKTINNKITIKYNKISNNNAANYKKIIKKEITGGAKISFRTSPSLFKYEMFNFVDKYDYLMIIDTDTVTLNSMKEIFDRNPDLFVVWDNWRKYGKLSEVTELNNDNINQMYFNAGFITVSNKLLKMSTTENLIQFHLKQKRVFKLLDQDLLNLFFKHLYTKARKNDNQLKYIVGPVRFNCLKRNLQDSEFHKRMQEIQPNFIHYVGKKPWLTKEVGYNHVNNLWFRIHRLYSEYLFNNLYSKKDVNLYFEKKT